MGEEPKIDRTYIDEAVAELNELFRYPNLVPQHLRDRLHKMDEGKTSVKSVKTSEGVSLEPSEEFQSLLASLRVHASHE